MYKRFFLICFAVIVPFLVSLCVLLFKQYNSSLLPLEKPSSSEAQEKVYISPLTIDRIFQHDKSYIATLSAERVRVINVTGDVIPARTVNTKTIGYNDFTWAFSKTAEVVRDADITFIDLETPILKTCPLTDSGMIFCGDKRHIEGIMSIGTDVVTLGNNHAGNYGAGGVEETVQTLTEYGIEVTGVTGRIAYKTVDGMRFAFLGYDDIEPNHVSRAEDTAIKKEIQQARNNADIVIVQFHWGPEYVAQPSSRQIYLGHLAVDSGADLVIGNHPHWIQPVELYKGTLIAYAHGNYIFDQMWSQKTREGVLGRYYFYDNRLIDVEFIPLEIHDYGQAVWLTDDPKQQILNDMKKQSEILSENINRGW